MDNPTKLAMAQSKIKSAKESLFEVIRAEIVRILVIAKNVNAIDLNETDLEFDIDNECILEQGNNSYDKIWGLNKEGQFVIGDDGGENCYYQDVEKLELSVDMLVELSVYLMKIGSEEIISSE